MRVWILHHSRSLGLVYIGAPKHHYHRIVAQLIPRKRWQQQGEIIQKPSMSGLAYCQSVRLPRDDSKYGYDSDGQNFYLKLYHELQKMVLISFKDLYKIAIFPKFHRCGSKIVPATPIWSLNFKRAWQAQFLSHTYETLENCLFFIDL